MVCTFFFVLCVCCFVPIFVFEYLYRLLFLLVFALWFLFHVICSAQVKAEKRLRQSRAGHSILNFGTTGGTRYSGVNFVRSSRFAGATREFNTPPPSSPRKNHVGRSAILSAKPGEVATQLRQNPDAGVGALERWVSTKKPDALVSGTPPGSSSPRPQVARGSPAGFRGVVQRAGPNWQHARLDSCAASRWGDPPENESMLSPRSDISMGSDCGKESRAHWLAQSSRILHGSEWNGLGNTAGSLRSNHDFNDTAGSSMFYGLSGLGPQESVSQMGVEEGNEEEEEEGKVQSVGRMEQTESAWQNLNSKYAGRPPVDGAEDGDAMSCWDGSPKVAPAPGAPPSKGRHF